MKLKNNEDKLGIGLFLLSLIFLIFATYISFTQTSMWFDEIFSYELVRHSFTTISNNIAIDVHPPLYFYIYKIFNDAALLIGINDARLVGKFVSILPIYLLFILAITKIKNNFGLLTTGLFTFTVLTMPQMMSYCVQIRMYGWGILFTVLIFTLIYDIIKNKANNLTWIFLTIITIASFYTHYYLCLTIGLLYLFLLAYILKHKKTELKKWFISAIVAILAFIPQILIFINQAAKVTYEYWIEPITIERIIGYIFFVFSAKNENISGNQIASVSIIGILLLISAIVLIALFFKNKKDSSSKFAISGIIIAILIPLIGIIISLLIKPTFHPRYMIPALGIFWLGISILLAKNYDKKIVFIPILAIILISSVVGCAHFYDNQVFQQQESDNFTNLTTTILGTDNIIICDTLAIYIELYSYFLPNSTCYHIESTERHHDATINAINELLQEPTVQKAIKEGKHIYFLKNEQPGMHTYDKNFTEDYGNFTLIDKNITIIKSKDSFEYLKVYEVIPKS